MIICSIYNIPYFFTRWINRYMYVCMDVRSFSSSYLFKSLALLLTSPWLILDMFRIVVVRHWWLVYLDLNRILRFFFCSYDLTRWNIFECFIVSTLCRHETSPYMQNVKQRRRKKSISLVRIFFFLPRSCSRSHSVAFFRLGIDWRIA